MCEACQALVGAGRHTSPHAALVPGESRKAALGGMRAHERDYQCSTGGHEWTHETGNSDEGWM
jgi:hypothetical protein